MKKKIGEIYNKPIVVGDKNLVTKNEIHKSELSGGSDGDAPSGGSSYEYYDISNVVAGKALLAEMATLVKTQEDITTLGLKLSANKTLMDIINSINAIAIDKDCLMFPGQNMTVGEFFAMAQSQTGANPTPITKEEFYSL